MTKCSSFLREKFIKYAAPDIQHKEKSNWPIFYCETMIYHSYNTFFRIFIRNKFSFITLLYLLQQDWFTKEAQKGKETEKREVMNKKPLKDK